MEPESRLSWFLRKAKGRLISDLTYSWLLVAKRVRVGGRTYRLRTSARLNLVRAASQRLAYETAHDGLIKRLLDSKPGAFIDIGANVGQTLLKLLSIDRDRDYIGVEPQISSALNIDLFIKDNGLSNHTILPVAVGEKDGLLKIGTRFADDTAASISFDVRPIDFYPIVQSVLVISGDNLVRRLDLRNISVIKIDVEGAEIQVLRGFVETIKTEKPFVIFEVLPKVLRSTMQRLSDDIIAVREDGNRQISKFFRDSNYVLYLLEDDGRLVERKDLFADETEITNYLAAPVDWEVKAGEADTAK